MVWPLHHAVLLAGMSVVLAACAPAATLQATPTQLSPSVAAAASPPWSCAPEPPRLQHSSRLYIIHSTGKELRQDWAPWWGNDPAQRGPTRIVRLDPQSGATLAQADGPAIGFTYHTGSNLIARMAFRFDSRHSPFPELMGFEVLEGDSLQRVRVFAAPLGLFPAPLATLQGANLALVGKGDRLVVIEQMGKDGPTSFGPPSTVATCLDLTQPLRVMSRVTGDDFPDELRSCDSASRRQVVRTASDGSLLVLAIPCVAPMKLRLYRIDARGSVTFHDLPFFEYEVPLAVTPDGTLVFVADPRHQEVYAIATDSGQVLWQQQYGQPPATKHKYAAAPNQIELAPDGAHLYLISHPTHAPGQGVWIIDPQTGQVLAHLLTDVRVTGIAASPTGDLYVVSPDAGGRLWVLPHGDPKQQRLLRDDLGDQLSGVLVGR